MAGLLHVSAVETGMNAGGFVSGARKEKEGRCKGALTPPLLMFTLWYRRRKGRRRTRGRISSRGAYLLYLEGRMWVELVGRGSLYKESAYDLQESQRGRRLVYPFLFPDTGWAHLRDSGYRTRNRSCRREAFMLHLKGRLRVELMRGGRLGRVHRTSRDAESRPIRMPFRLSLPFLPSTEWLTQPELAYPRETTLTIPTSVLSENEHGS